MSTDDYAAPESSRTRGLSANGTAPVQRDADGDVLEPCCCPDASIVMVPGEQPTAACEGCDATLARGLGDVLALLNRS